MSSRLSSGRGYLTLIVSVVLSFMAYMGFHFLAPYHSTIVEWNLRQSLFFWVALGVLLLVFVILFVLPAELMSAQRTVSRAALVLAGVVALGALFVWGFYVFSYHDYQQARRYLPSVEVVTSPVPELGQRVPFNIALAQTRSNLGGTVGDIEQTAYLPGSDRYGTLIERIGWDEGYEVVLEQHFELTGRGVPSTCEFAPGGARVGGWLSHNLGRQIAQEKRGVRFSPDDVYGFCRGETPIVVVPLKEQDGVLTVTERFVGVALYDGRTQEIQITVETEGLPGPSYPMSLASTQREATQGMGSYLDWLFGRVGWELTETSDINSAGAAEYVLAASPDLRYVTPLTARRGSTAVSAISTLAPGEVVAGRARLRVHPLEPVWVDPAAIEDRIRSDFADLGNWQQFQLFELAPLDGDRWVASFGREQNLVYRVQGVGDLSEPPCLYAADGSEIRCGPPSGGVSPEPGEGGLPVPAPGELSRLSDAELGDLGRQVAEEAARRLAGS